MIPDIAVLADHLESIAALALQSRFPAIGYRREFAEAGGLLSYGPVWSEMEVRAAAQVDRILRGATPAELPVEHAMKFASGWITDALNADATAPTACGPFVPRCNLECSATRCGPPAGILVDFRDDQSEGRSGISQAISGRPKSLP